MKYFKSSSNIGIFYPLQCMCMCIYICMPLYICVHSHSNNNVPYRLLMYRYALFYFLISVHHYWAGQIFFLNLCSCKISMIYSLQRLHIFHSINFDNLIDRKNNLDFILIRLYMTCGTKNFTVHLIYWN